MKCLLFLVVCIQLVDSIRLSAETPNIIVILVDDMGYGDIQKYNPAAKTTTPNLDAMADAGMRFTDFHTNSAVCTPTRYGLLTGRYAWRTRLKSGVLNGQSRRLILPGRETIASLLKKQNYRTANIGKWHLGMTDTDGFDNIYLNSTPAQRQLGTNSVGFDYWYGIPASLDFTPYTILSDGNLVNMQDDVPSPPYNTWATQPGISSPVFVRQGPEAPGFRFGLDPSASLTTHPDPAPVAGEVGVNERFLQKALEYITDHEANHPAQPFFIYQPLPGPHAPWVPKVLASHDARAGIQREDYYLSYINEIDAHLGALVARLEDPNGDGDNSDSVTDDTLIIFTSDNGADSNQFNEAAAGHDINLNWRGQKADIHEAGHRVPFLVKWPGKITPGSVTAETACMTDIFATIADIVEEPYGIGAGEDSWSLKKVWLGEPFTSPVRGPVVHHSLNGMFAIREGKWKLIFGTGSGGFSGSAGEGSNTRTDDTPQRLYDLIANPGEVFAQNQLSSETAVVTDLHAKLDAIRDNPRSAPHPDLLDDDGDGMNNGFENLYGLDKDDPSDATADLDMDGLTNVEEFQLGTNPTAVDSDGDKRPDGLEDANQNGVLDPDESDPTKKDTDGDGIDDLIESAFGTDFTDVQSFPDPSASAVVQCLILDDFENGNVATGNVGENGGVQLVQNGVASGESISEPAGGSDLLVNTGTVANGNVGVVSVTSIDFANSAEGVRLTWEISSMTSLPQVNGLFVGVVDGTSFYRLTDNIGLVFNGTESRTASNGGFSFVIGDNNGNGAADNIVDTGQSVQLSSLLDGFTVVLEFTSDGWSYQITGLNNSAGNAEIFANAGTWVAAGEAANFYSTFFGGNERMLASVQREASALNFQLGRMKAESLIARPFYALGSLSNESEIPSFALVWNSRIGETYRVESSEDLENWNVVASGLPSAGMRTSYLYEDADLPPAEQAKSRWFFRVVLE